jgi:hypothetical protein
MIRLAQPALDLFLKGGERLSRVVEREDLDWTPPRAVAKTEPRPRLNS